MPQTWRPPQAVSLLEYGTKLVGVSRGYWGVNLFPGAGEGIVTFQSAYQPRPSGQGGNPEDPEESRRVAARRARTHVRRYCAANRLNRLATLTYRGQGCHEPVRLRSDVGVFFRRLRQGIGGTAFPYLWTGEWHKTGHGLHAHFAVGRFVPRTKIEDAWPHGFVHIKLLGDLSYAATSLDQARKAARYLSKYVGKSFAEPGQRLHRYEVAQGFAPRCEGFSGRTSNAAVAWAEERMGRAADFVQPSTQWEHYRGPSAVFLSWK
jgi:hypothetical protein